MVKKIAALILCSCLSFSHGHAMNSEDQASEEDIFSFDLNGMIFAFAVAIFAIYLDPNEILED